MPTYKKACMQCGTLIDGDSDFCPACGSGNPFGYHCPDCRKPIEKSYKRCPGCGRQIYVTCPHCGQPTFVQDTCEHCGKSLLVPCPAKKCGTMNFFDRQKCLICGKKLKPITAEAGGKKKLFK